MTKAELWSRYTARNPRFDGPGNVTLSAAGLRKLFEQTWDQGHEKGFQNGIAWEKVRADARKGGSDPLEDIRSMMGL